MILTIWTVLLVLSLVVVIGGKYVNSPPLQISGFFFLFLLGITLLSGGVQYKNGVTETYNYMCLGCGGNSIPTFTGNASIDKPFVSSISKADTYSNYSGEVVYGIMLHHVFGFFVTVLSILGFISCLINLRPDGDVE